MKKHISFFVFIFFPLFIYCQTIAILDTNSSIILKPKFYSVNSFEKNTQQNSTYLLGLSFHSRFSENINFSSSVDYLFGNRNIVFNKYVDSLGVLPSFDLDNKRVQLNLSYQINKFINIKIGKGKHFIGEGYRSLFLSKEHAPYNYLKISTEFGKIKYYNFYTTFINQNMLDIGRKKHAAIHYLNYSINKYFHFGLFEAILWQSKTYDFNTGYELAYLNPVIFYRPVEFSKHSSKGNALLGASFDINIYKTTFYSQFLLDDLNISRRKDQDENYQGGFFQNKFAYQFGVKTKLRDINILTEYNQVQPYTYGHRTILQNYSHMNQALAHPLGANFKELVLRSDYTLNNWRFFLTLSTSKIGLDSIGTHYGQNIFASDLDASTGGQYSYGNFNGQGVNTMLNTLLAEISYSIKSFDVFGSVLYRKKDSDLVSQNLLFYSIGLRNFPFSTLKDY